MEVEATVGVKKTKKTNCYDQAIYGQGSSKDL